MRKSAPIMNPRVLALSALLAIFSALPAAAQTAAPDSVRVPEPAPVLFQGDTIVTLRATVADVSAARRAEAAASRLEALDLPHLLQPLRIEPLEQGFVILIRDEFILGISSADVDSASGATAASTTQLARRRLEQAIAERARLLSPAARWRGALEAVAGTIG